MNCTGTCWAFSTIPLGTATAAADGTLNTKITVPDGLGGWHAVQLVQGSTTMAQVPFFVKRSFASAQPISDLTLHAGQHFTIHLKGLGWTQLDNTIAVDYDNAYMGYGCGFNSQGDTVLDMVATGAPGTHLIDMYPLLYTQQPSYREHAVRDDPDALVRVRPSRARARVPVAGDALGDHGRQVGGPGTWGSGAAAPLPHALSVTWFA